jgi:hypothetical protein
VLRPLQTNGDLLSCILPCHSDSARAMFMLWWPVTALRSTKWAKATHAVVPRWGHVLAWYCDAARLLHGAMLVIVGSPFVGHAEGVLLRRQSSNQAPPAVVVVSRVLRCTHLLYKIPEHLQPYALLTSECTVPVHGQRY